MTTEPPHLIPSEGGLTETILHRFCPWCKNEFKFGDMFCEVCGSSRGSIKIQEGLVSKPRWRKILYKKQPYEDNYVDETFLMGLKKNAHFSVYSLREVVQESTVITQQLSAVVLFMIIFIFTLNNTVSVTFLTSFGVSTVALGFLTRIITDGSYTMQGVLVGMKTLILLFGSLFTLSPVLRTLTNSISDDTITACTTFLLAVHMFFHDYSYVNGSTHKFSAPVSLNAAIFASVLLASRLPSNLHVFALISIAIEIFALFPILRHYIKKYSEYYHQLLTVVMIVFSFAGLVSISVTLATIYAASVIFITIGCPFWLIIIQKYKNEINGPWDEAVPVTRFE